MKKARIGFIIAAACCITGLTLGQSRSGTPSERAHFDRLSARMVQAHREYQDHFSRAVSQARATGEAQADTKARLLALRDEQDFLREQLMLLSSRYGWEIPDPATYGQQGADQNAEAAAEEQPNPFEAVDELLRRYFEEEAIEIARSVRLPATPVIR